MKIRTKKLVCARSKSKSKKPRGGFISLTQEQAWDKAAAKIPHTKDGMVGSMGQGPCPEGPSNPAIAVVTEKSMKLSLPQVKDIEEHINETSLRIAELDLKIKHNELNETEMMDLLIKIESARVKCVGEIWDVVNGLLGQIKTKMATTTDIQKLGVVFGILVDKGQLIQGRPTVNLGIQNKGPSKPLSERLTAYQGLMRKKPGRPSGGGGPERAV